MGITRRKIVISSLLFTTQYFLNIRAVQACIGSGPYITKIKKEHLRNVQFLGHKEYLNNMFPAGYKYSSNIEIDGFTNVENRKHININSGKVQNSKIYHLESQLQLTISLKNINQEHQCENIRIIFQDKTNIGNGPCFEVARVNFSKTAHPYFSTRIKSLSGQNPSFFIVAEINEGNDKSKILVSNIYPFKRNCDGSNYLEIKNA